MKTLYLNGHKWFLSQSPANQLFGLWTVRCIASAYQVFLVGALSLEGGASTRGDKLARVINENLIKLILQSTISHSMFGTNTSYHVK